MSMRTLDGAARGCPGLEIQRCVPLGAGPSYGTVTVSVHGPMTLIISPLPSW